MKDSTMIGMKLPMMICRLNAGTGFPARVWAADNGEVHMFIDGAARCFVHFVDGPKEGPSWGAVLGNANDALVAIALKKAEQSITKKGKRNGQA